MSECGDIRIRTEGSFIWHIPHFSYFRHKYNSALISPDIQFNGYPWYVATDPNRKELNKLALIVRRRVTGHPYPRISACRMRVKYINSDGQNRWYSPVLTKEFPSSSDLSTRCAVCIEFALPGSPSLLTLGDVLSLHLTFDLPKSTSPTPTQAVVNVEETKPRSCTATDAGTHTYAVDRLLQNFKDLLLRERKTDVILKVGGTEFKAHKIILSARSPVFEKMFDHDMLEESSGCVTITDCEPEDFHTFLLFLYTGKLEKPTVKSAVGLYCLADKYNVEDLGPNCVQYLRSNFSATSYCDIVSLGLLYRDTELISSANAFFAKNLKQIVGTEQWKSFITENPAEGSDILIQGLSQVNLLPIET